MAAPVAVGADGRPLVRIGNVFTSGTRAWLPVLELNGDKSGTWVLAVDRHMRALGQDVLPCFVVWRPAASDDVLQMENRS